MMNMMGKFDIMDTDISLPPVGMNEGIRGGTNLLEMSGGL